MRRRILLPAAAAVAAAIAVVVALRDGGPPAANPGMAFDPLGDVCVSESLRLRAATKLGRSAPRPPDGSAKQARQGMPLRMDRALGSIISSAQAAESAPAAEAPPAAPPVERRSEARGPIRLDLLSRPRDLGEPAEADEAFAPRSWVVVAPPPPPPPPAPPEPPRAPPLPFRFAGLLDDGAGRVSYFLLRGNAMLAVAVGDKIDGTYLLDSAEGGMLQFTYLPLQERQRLPYGVPQ